MHGDRAGDPLDGLVNLFDLTLVLAVGFLLAALSAVGQIDVLTGDHQNLKTPSGVVLPAAPPTTGQSGQGQGQPVGTVYRLEDGTYIFKAQDGTTVATTPSTGATVAPSPATPSPATTTPGATGIPPASTTPTPATPVVNVPFTPST